jgi:hypothetical protein
MLACIMRNALQICACVRVSWGGMLTDLSVGVGRMPPWGSIPLALWQRVLMRIEEYCATSPWREILPSSCSAWKELKFC